MASRNSKQGPVCLIENKDKVGLIINQKALQILNDIPQPLVVVAIVGKYRTGKSYLMNNLARSKKGFALGASIQSMTKGIWMWCVPHPFNPSHTLVLLDTEGLGDVEKGDSDNDSWIFCLSVLLSSNLVINSMGTIDQQAMEQLHYVTELTKRIRLKSSNTKGEEDSAEYKRVFPSFTWCVRDFCLKLVLNGQEITEDEYLKNSLKLKSGMSKNIKDYNLPRECIHEYFHSHKCFVFDRPASTENLHRLEDLKDRDLNMQFVKQTEKFCQYIFQEGRIKTLAGGQQLNGRLLGQLAVTYVKAIQSKSVPCLESAVITLAKTENEGAVKEAVSTYNAQMKECEEEFSMETQDELLNMHRWCEQEALKVFLERSFQDKEQKYQWQLKTLLEKRFKVFRRSNEMKSEEICTAWLGRFSATMERKIQTGAYMRSGGHKQFLEDKLCVVDNYNSVECKGIKALEVLQNFLIRNKDIEAGIMQADKTISENQKLIKAREAEAEAARREREILEMENKYQEKLRLSEQRSFEQHERMLYKKMEEDKAQIIRENKWLLDQKVKEMENLKNEEFEGQISRLQREINKLKNKNKKEEESGICVIA